MTHPLSRYVPLLIEGDLQGLLDLFREAPRINDPWQGWVDEARFDVFVAASSEGLLRMRARVEHVATTATPQGAVEECVLCLVRRGETVRLPVAIAAAVSANLLTSIHVYHSMQPLTGAHAVRSPILAAQPGLALPPIVARYQQGLTAADVFGLVEQFHEDGLIREPDSEGQVHRGRAGLGRFFSRLVAPGGMSLEGCSLTDDGSSCALEYNLTEWDDLLFPHQAGLAVYERAHGGLLAAVRLYDDIERQPSAWA